MFSRRNLLIITIALVGILIIGCAPKDDVSNDDQGVAATVNGIDISMKIFEDSVERMIINYKQQGIDLEGEQGKTMLEQINQKAIDSLIQSEVLLQAAKDKGYEVSEEVLGEELSQVKGQFETQEQFKEVLEANKFTESSFKEMLADELTIREFIENELEEATVSEDEVIKMYDEYKAQLEDQSQEEDLEIPAFDDIKVQIEEQIKKNKEQEQFQQVLDELMENSEIEIFI